jgi:hypothetical protein
MASLSESPAMRQARETAFRDKSLLNKQYRQARASGDFGRAMTVAQQADKMGMPVGVSGSFDQLAQTGQRRYEQSMFAAGQQPEKTGLAGFDFRQASQRGAVGVGGYDFRQAAQRQPMQPAQDMAPQAPSSQRVPPAALSTTVPGGAPATPAQQQGSPAPRPELASQFTDIWGKAKTQEQKDSVLLAAYKAGVPLNDFGSKELLRATSNFLPEQPPEQQSNKLTFTNTAGQPVMTDAGRQYYENAKQQYEAKPETVVMRQKEEQQRRLQLLDRDLSAKRKAEDRWASRVQFGKEQKAFSENYDKETDAQMRKYDAEVANLESGQFESAAAMQKAANVEKAEDEAYYSTLAGRNESLMLGRMPQRTQGFADAMRKRNAATIKTRNEWRPKPRPTVNWRDSTPYAPPLR